MHEMETFITMAKEDIRNQKFTLQKVRRLFLYSGAAASVGRYHGKWRHRIGILFL